MHDVLDDQGLFFLEFADLASIIKYNMFDTICHEHAEYYSTDVLIKMFQNNNLELLDIRENDINGSSKQYILSKKNSKFFKKKEKINKVLLNEKKLKLDNYKTYKIFFQNIKKIGTKLKKFLEKQIKNNKIIHGYGASTKGNTLLQFLELENII